MGSALDDAHMHRRQSRTRSREDSVKRRELEARRVPSMRPALDEGFHTYSFQRPSGGRDFIPASLTSRAATGTQQVPRARPVVEPIQPMPGQIRARPVPFTAPVRGTQPVDMHDDTDVVAVRTWSPAARRPGHRRLGLGWWIALAVSAAFFLAAAALGAI